MNKHSVYDEDLIANTYQKLTKCEIELRKLSRIIESKDYEFDLELIEEELHQLKKAQANLEACVEMIVDRLQYEKEVGWTE